MATRALAYDLILLHPNPNPNLTPTLLVMWHNPAISGWVIIGAHRKTAGPVL